MLSPYFSGSLPLFGQQRAYTSGVLPAPWHSGRGVPDLQTLVGLRPSFHGFALGDLVLRAPTPKKEQALVDLCLGLLGADIAIEFDWHAQQIPGTGYKRPKGDWESLSIAKVLPGGENHASLLISLDKIARFFSRLPQPILFRPWHEMSGNWFWWGSQNPPSDFISLWRLTIDYMRERGLDIIPIYAPNYRGPRTEEAYEKTYPGDDYVGIVGFDWYNPTPKKGIENCLFLKDYHGKPIAFTEGGVRVGGYAKKFKDLESDYWQELGEFMGNFNFLYYRTWGGPYLPTKGRDLEQFKAFLTGFKTLPVYA